MSARDGWDPSFSYSNLLFWKVATIWRPSSGNHVTSIGFKVIVTQSLLARANLKVLPASCVATMTSLPYLALGVGVHTQPVTQGTPYSLVPYFQIA